MFFHTPHILTSVGGEIQSLAWDPTGERLAVLLKGPSHLDEPSQYYYTFIAGFNDPPLICSQGIRSPPTGPQSSPCLRREADPFLSSCHGLHLRICRS